MGTVSNNVLLPRYIKYVKEIGWEELSTVLFNLRGANPSSNNKTLNARLLARVLTGCHYT